MFALGLPRCPYISVSISAECLDPLGREHRLPALFLSAQVTAVLHHLLVCSIHYSIAWIGSLRNSISTSLFELFLDKKKHHVDVPRWIVRGVRCPIKKNVPLEIKIKYWQKMEFIPDQTYHIVLFWFESSKNLIAMSKGRNAQFSCEVVNDFWAKQTKLRNSLRCGAARAGRGEKEGKQGKLEWELRQRLPSKH